MYICKGPSQESYICEKRPGKENLVCEKKPAKRPMEEASALSDRISLLVNTSQKKTIHAEKDTCI